jgi:hypothetical protein
VSGGVRGQDHQHCREHRARSHHGKLLPLLLIRITLAGSRGDAASAITRRSGLGPLPSAAGPAVRIRLPPAASQERTVRRLPAISARRCGDAGSAKTVGYSRQTVSGVLVASGFAENSHLTEIGKLLFRATQHQGPAWFFLRSLRRRGRPGGQRPAHPDASRRDELKRHSSVRSRGDQAKFAG